MASLQSPPPPPPHHCQTYPYPEFYKMYVPDNSSERLHVPPSFVSYLSGKGKPLPDRVFLRSRRHRSMIWEVEVNQREKEAGGVFFHDGWKIFVADLSLELGDLLTFRFDGDRTFYFTVFGTSMTEKEEDIGSDVDDDGDNDDGIDVKRYLESTKNPYFVAKMKNKRNSSLRLPKKLLQELKARDLKLNGTVTLCDSDGNRWSGNVSTWSDGRSVIHGWSAFFKKKSLGADDKCICEFVVEDGENTFKLVRVHIVRA